jgi:hypothetical protein
LSSVAVLCGCESIIVPHETISIEEVESRRQTLGFPYGIAYGIDDLDHATSTKHLLRNHYEQHELEQIKKTDLEIKKILLYFKYENNL